MKKLLASLFCIPLLLIAACGTDNTPPQTEVEVDRSVYPDGPYGVSAGSIIDNLDFMTSEGTPFDLNMLHADESRKLLLITTSAGWCAACIEEQPFLRELYTNNVDAGLEVVVSVFEDSQFQPADVELAADWKENYSLPFTVLADSEQKFSAYYNTEATPMTMFVDLDTMEILNVLSGADRSVVESLVESLLE